MSGRLNRVLIFLSQLTASAAISLMICLAILTYGFYWFENRQARLVFLDNFAMSLTDISHLSGEEKQGGMGGYEAWLSFISERPPILKHPEWYRNVPCHAHYFYPKSDPFTPMHISEEEMKNWEAQLQCKEGEANVWVRQDGTEAFDESWIAYDPQTRKVRMDIIGN